MVTLLDRLLEPVALAVHLEDMAVVRQSVSTAWRKNSKKLLWMRPAGYYIPKRINDTQWSAIRRNKCNECNKCKIDKSI
jgi:hypothetical protein